MPPGSSVTRCSHALFAVNAIAFPLLLLTLSLRLARFHRELWADLINPRLVFSFFTIVAAFDVFGRQLFVRGYQQPAVALWLGALLVWTLLGYLSFSVLTFANTERGADVVHGGWLVAIVGTESLVLLGTQLAPHFGALTPLAFVTIYHAMFWSLAFPSVCTRSRPGASRWLLTFLHCNGCRA